EEGRPVLHAVAGGALVSGLAPFSLALAQWVELILSFDPAQGVLRLVVREDGIARSFELVITGQVARPVPGAWASLRLAASGANAAHSTFDGRIEAPLLWGQEIAAAHALA